MSRSSRVGAKALIRRLGRMLVTEIRSSTSTKIVVPLTAAAAALVVALDWPIVVWISLLFVAVTSVVMLASVRLARIHHHLLPRLLASLGIGHLTFFMSFESRSPKIAIALERAWRGFETGNLSLVEEIARDSSSRRVDRVDAALSLANWHQVHGEPDQATDWLTFAPKASVGGRLSIRQRKEIVALAAEARAWAGPALADRITALDLPSSPHQLEGRRSVSPFDLVRANLIEEFDPVCFINRRLVKERFQAIRFDDGWFDADVPPRRNGLHAQTPLVSVIVPVFNGAATVARAIDSIRKQTWPNIEIIVVDDASSDDTAIVVERLRATDPRLRVVTLTINSGPYVSRNTGVGESRGEFITVLDADDWMHPQRIEIQVIHLLTNDGVIANRTTLVRVTEEGRIVRRGIDFGDYAGPNTASLMCRRAAVDRIGLWDPIRAGADSEFIDRLRARYGPECVVDLHRSAPLTICRASRSSLTAHSSTGILSLRWDSGFRNLYHQSYQWWHRQTDFVLDSATDSDVSRPTPASLSIGNRKRPTEVDVVLLSDLSLPGGTTASNIEELTANERLSLRTGLVHNRAPHLRHLPVNHKFFAAPHELRNFLHAGDQVKCDVLVVKYPPAALELPDRFPDIEVAGDVVVAVNQAPWTGYSGDRREVYRIADVDATLTQRFGKRPIWSPIGPAIREVLERHHADELRGVRLSNDDWYEIIDWKDWLGDHHPRSEGIFRIGRHARDSEWKWPSNRVDLLSAYPSDCDIEVSILGGAEIPRKILGRLPSNWRVQPFDSVNPRDYLLTLDALVYFPHPDMVEGFGRTILEALAVGVPVITDQRFTPLFGDSIITVTPTEVSRVIDQLRADPDYRQTMHDRARHAAAERFGYATHLDRLRRHGLDR